MRKIIASGLIALNTLLLLSLPTPAQTQSNFDLSGEWVWTGTSSTGSDEGCTAGYNDTFSMEAELLADRQGFAELERDSDAFLKFAYGTHPDAYCKASWRDLPKADRDKIIEAVDNIDLYSWLGLTTGWELAINKYGFWFDIFPL